MLDNRIKLLEDNLESLFIDFDLEQKKTTDNILKLDGHHNLLNAHNEQINDMQNTIRRMTDVVKLKADGEEIDGVNTLVNELYDKFNDLEKSGSNLITTNTTAVNNNNNQEPRRMTSDLRTPIMRS